MSFASTKDVIQVYQENLSQFNLVENMVHTMYSEVLPKGVYYVSYSPYMLTTVQTNLFETIYIWIGSGFGSVDAYEVANLEIEPYDFRNAGYFTPSMAGIFSSDGELPLTIRVSASTTNAGTYGAYVSTVGSYDFNMIRLS
jgi:hypothetical protein